jgi:hypothetical protein
MDVLRSVSLGQALDAFSNGLSWYADISNLTGKRLETTVTTQLEALLPPIFASLRKSKSDLLENRRPEAAYIIGFVVG